MPSPAVPAGTCLSPGTGEWGLEIFDIAQEPKGLVVVSIGAGELMSSHLPTPNCEFRRRDRHEPRL